MDVNYLMTRARARARAQARAAAGAIDSAYSRTLGAAAGEIDDGDWRIQLSPDARQRIVNKIMETLMRHLPTSGQEGVRELKKIAVRFEEKIYTAAASRQDYLRTIAIKMLTMETKSQNPNAHGPEAASYETISGPEESDEEEDDGDVSKEDGLEEVVVTEEQKTIVGHKENVKAGENEISCGLNSGAKLDERLVQVEERLKKMEAHSEKVETLLVDINKKLNYLVKMQDVNISRDIKHPTKCMSSSWTGNGQLKRKHRVAEMIRRSCKHRRLGRGAIVK
ncbi:uncharacterized protein LOC132613419 isoform X2 [Lycium barbarum]|uniref:uncharacterized protein LOC132613419 isoform X2 n=1 Tax=Lycium barbarum TaxID=112863 RepID=UPI00293F6206|nr:uncharacterized protein LOC132613419 isoform X2 [Lycium barbarum]